MAKEMGPKERALREMREARAKAMEKPKATPKPATDATTASPKKPRKRKPDA